MFSYISATGCAILTVTMALIAIEVGARLGRKVSFHRSMEGKNSEFYTLQGSALALLGLLLGFCFSMAASRYEIRRERIVQEANAIGTAYLRADLLPEPYRGESQRLYRDYVTLRIEYADGDISDQRFAEGDLKSGQIHRQLWQEAMKGVKASPQPMTGAVYLPALNQVIDLHDMRVAAGRNHLPVLIVWLLILLTTMAMGMAGYGSGLGGHRNRVSMIITTVMIAGVVFMVIDLDQPRTGLIQVSHEPLIRLQQSLTSSP